MCRCAILLSSWPTHPLQPADRRALIVENGGWGASVAAPIARKVFDYWLDPARVAERQQKLQAEHSAQAQVVKAPSQPDTAPAPDEEGSPEPAPLPDGSDEPEDSAQEDTP
ncbi:Peptidoglycan D,D-transpeptidase MrdA OS=Castellaniella defragrans OX=75697 GN=mrdA PE=3 SV=1 [Castellaniella defragrans]